MTEMCKLDKIFTCVLGVCFVLFILTGFDIQQRLLAPQISSFIHLKWIVLPSLVAFTFHTVYKSYLRICRCDRFVRTKKALLWVYAAFLVLLTGYFVYYSFFAVR